MLGMTFDGVHEISLRPDRRESSRLAWAFGISLAVHLLAWGTFETGRKFHVWEKLQAPAWMKALALPVPKPVKKDEPQREIPLVFINVNPEHAAAEPPKDTKYYSSHNSRAANPEADRNTDMPKITGTQTQVAKTEDVPREKFEKLQPSFPVAPEPEPEAKPKPTLSPGDLTLAKPDLNPRTETGDAERSRPRTIKEALARKQLDRVPGQKMKQDGGVQQRAKFSMVDAKGTSFGAYDAAFIEAVSQRWYDLLDGIRYDGLKPGKVVLQFHLNYDGRITEMKVAESSVDQMLSLLCEKAVLDPAPFEKWPMEMRRMIGRDVRPIQFTFYYN